MINHQVNILRIKAVNELLEELCKNVVYVGGATVSLYVDRVGPDFRSTQDVDILVEVASTGDYLAMQEKLIAKGFAPDDTANFVGRFTTDRMNADRYVAEKMIIDLMATQKEIVGFSNLWYPEGFKNAIDYKLDEEQTVKIFSAPHFIASKLEAFHSRGGNDGRTSTDFEDIIYVLENRRAIWEEMNNAEPRLKEYLVNEFEKCLDNPYLEEWIDGHTGFHSPPPTYYLLDQWEKFAKGKLDLFGR